MESLVGYHKQLFLEFLNSLNSAWVLHPEDDLNCTPQTIQFLVAFCQKFATAKSELHTVVEFLVRDPRLKQGIATLHFENPEDKDWVYTDSVYEYEQQKERRALTFVTDFDRIVLRAPLLHPLNQTVPFQLKFVCRDVKAIVQSECVCQYHPCADPGWNSNALMKVVMKLQ